MQSGPSFAQFDYQTIRKKGDEGTIGKEGELKANAEKKLSERQPLVLSEDELKILLLKGKTQALNSVKEKFYVYHESLGTLLCDHLNNLKISVEHQGALEDVIRAFLFSPLQSYNQNSFSPEHYKIDLFTQKIPEKSTTRALKIETYPEKMRDDWNKLLETIQRLAVNKEAVDDEMKRISEGVLGNNSNYTEAWQVLRIYGVPLQMENQIIEHLIEKLKNYAIHHEKTNARHKLISQDWQANWFSVNKIYFKAEFYEYIREKYVKQQDSQKIKKEPDKISEKIKKDLVNLAAEQLKRSKRLSGSETSRILSKSQPVIPLLNNLSRIAQRFTQGPSPRSSLTSEREEGNVTNESCSSPVQYSTSSSTQNSDDLSLSPVASLLDTHVYTSSDADEEIIQNLPTPREVAEAFKNFKINDPHLRERAKSAPYFTQSAPATAREEVASENVGSSYSLSARDSRLSPGIKEKVLAYEQKENELRKSAENDNSRKNTHQ